MKYYYTLKFNFCSIVACKSKESTDMAGSNMDDSLIYFSICYIIHLK